MREVTFQWSEEHGPCYDCGLPAAFFNIDSPEARLCAICAANNAAEGYHIGRIDTE